ncbi:MAG TPA: Fic family protein [Puia sp.]|nr:Fic family protein [Puia sp.]
MPPIYTFSFEPDWMKLTNELSQIDRFDASWSAIEKREGQSLKQLKMIATVRSVGASTRIEGAKMTDDEVGILIKNLEVSKLEERDQQEVAGYFRTLDIISESFRAIEITDGNIKNLHKILLGYSTKDEWHKGNYKQHSNVVEATNAGGSKRVIFQTTDPGFATEEAMRRLIEWYRSDTVTHPLIRTAIFVYDFLSIHPFQDGNGRMSRLLSTLLLLRQGYSWIEYVSFEHEIENRKSEYYAELMQCQSNRPGEEVSSWVLFFLDCLKNIQNLLIKKLEVQASSDRMSPREKMVYVYVENHPGSKSGAIAEKLDIPLPTAKRILADMVANKALLKHGAGAGTNYTIENRVSIKKDRQFRLGGTDRKKEFVLTSTASFIELKTIILTPLFEWVRPDEWVKRLFDQGLRMRVWGENRKGVTIEQFYPVSSYNTPYHFHPVFTLGDSIKIPVDLWGVGLFNTDYPIKITIELVASVANIDFEVMIVYDEA